MTPDAAADVLRPTYRQAVAVLAAVNSSTRYRSDPDLYGRAEFWTIASGEGDCEDFALAYRQRLLALGFDHGALRLALCRPGGQPHCVLIVTLDTGDDVVLDCRHSEPLRRDQLDAPIFAMQEGRAWFAVV